MDFLKKRGIEVENNPMAKIEPPVYQMLLDEFASDQQAKEKTEAVASKIREARETITLEDKKKGRTGSREDEEPEIDFSQFRRAKEAAKEAGKKPAAAVPAPASAPAQEATEATEEAETARKKTTRKKAEPAAETPAEEPQAAPAATPGEVKVVGKIDLDALSKPKSKGVKKKKEELI